MLKELFSMFVIFFRIGLFTIGGGYAMIPIMEEEFVEKGKLITPDTFNDAVAVSQSVPGVLAINASTFIGYQIQGIKGAVTGCVATMLPSIIIILTIAIFFNNLMEYRIISLIFLGLRPAIVGIIFCAFLKMGRALDRKYINYVIVTITFLALVIFNISPVILIILGGISGFFLFRKEAM